MGSGSSKTKKVPKQWGRYEDDREYGDDDYVLPKSTNSSATNTRRSGWSTAKPTQTNREVSTRRDFLRKGQGYTGRYSQRKSGRTPGAELENGGGASSKSRFVGYRYGPSGGHYIKGGEEAQPWAGITPEQRRQQERRRRSSNKHRAAAATADVDEEAFALPHSMLPPDWRIWHPEDLKGITQTMAIRVSSTPGECRTINEALRKVEAGGLIMVEGGIYEESLLIDKAVSIIGAAGSTQPVVLRGMPGKDTLRVKINLPWTIDMDVKHSLPQPGAGTVVYPESGGAGGTAVIKPSLKSLSRLAGLTATRIRPRPGVAVAAGRGYAAAEGRKGTKMVRFADEVEVEGEEGGSAVKTKNGPLTLSTAATEDEDDDDGPDGESNERSQRFEARIFNITIEHNPPASKYDTHGLAKTSQVNPQDEPCYAVNIDSGRARVQGCEIKSGGLACVAVHGAGEGLLINNTICDGADAGVFIFESGIAVLTENVIAGNCAVGVHIADSADVLLKHNTVEASGQAGVLVELSANATLEDNVILHNGAAGVEVRHKAWVTLLTNTVRQNKLEGVWVHKAGTAHVEKCTFSQNGRNGNIWVHADCQGNVVCDSNTFEGIGWSNFEIEDIEDSSDDST